MSTKSKEKKYRRDIGGASPESGKIRFVPPSLSGLLDAVEQEANASLTIFDHEEGEVTGIGSSGPVPCKLMSSYQNGTFSISIRGEAPFMVSIRLDELMALLHAASHRSKESTAKLQKKRDANGG